MGVVCSRSLAQTSRVCCCAPLVTRLTRCWRGTFCLRAVGFRAIIGVSKQKPTQKGNIAMSCNCQKCLYEDKPTTDFTVHSAGGDHATFDTRKLVAGTFVEIGARRFFKIGDPDVWVTRDGEHLTREEFARVVQNTTTPVIVNPAELRWYERPVDE